MSSATSKRGLSALGGLQEASSQAELWRRILEDPQLQDLPFRIETNQRGQLILSPHKRIHSLRQTQITDFLKEAVDRPGIRSVELAIQTSDGVKVVDAAWMSSERFREIPEEAEPTPIAPELCIEVLSSSNTAKEMEGKRALYFEAGAEEVWMVDPGGAVHFFGRDGALKKSRMAPPFPERLPDVA